MKLRALYTALSICVFSLSAFSATANAAEKTVTLRFANVSTKSSVDAARVLIDVAAKESNGRLKIEHYPNNMLGDDRVVIESVLMGDVGLAQVATSELAPLDPDMNLFDAPFLFKSADEAWRFVDGSIGKKITDELGAKNLKVMAMLELGFRNYTNNKHPVHVPADVKGQKMRVLNSEVHIATWKALGANPTPMSWGEVIPALQQGTIDSQEHPNVGMVYNKLYEVQHYISYTQHVFTVQPLVMNKKVFEKMDPKLQEALLKAVAAYQTEQRKLSSDIDKGAEAVYTKYGCEVTKLTDAERDQWRKTLLDAHVYDIVKSKMTHPEYLDDVLNGKF